MDEENNEIEEISSGDTNCPKCGLRTYEEICPMCGMPLAMDKKEKEEEEDEYYERRRERR